jgi:hypothetical protein
LFFAVVGLYFSLGAELAPGLWVNVKRFTGPTTGGYQ